MEHTLYSVCPRCLAVNRVAQQRMLQGPTCGKCQAPLLAPKPLELSAAQLDKFVAKSDLPLLVDFWAPWCGPCKMMAPAFEQAAKTLHPDVILAKVNTEQEQALSGQLGIRSIPTLVLFQNGKEQARVSGAMDAANLAQWARQHAKPLR